ncbi:hypothetical protein PS691_04018 [Pseudomonas fluorescens]|uniref:Guanylate cyclase domain-containing protein n=2 Tax=Pseudomonas fluorescens TaxID=294 RepID=A0A5E7DZN2_PSEFL|nr:hypothetical protein PS691_04018 [Pseudomonas fluorescens]
MLVNMNRSNSLNEGRYLLFLDILGFSDLVETRPTKEIYDVIDSALNAFGRWEKLNGLFKTIYFSDTFLFYQDPKGYGNWAFLDVYAIGSMVLSAMLAAGIAARGAISFGEFEVELDSSGRHQVYFGKALIEAYKAEQQEKWIGITVLPSAWEPYEAANPGMIDAFAREKVWLRRADGVLLLNPLIKLRGWYGLAGMGEVEKPYSKWDAPEFPNDILALKFIRVKAESYAAIQDFTSPVAIKFHTTHKFLKDVLGDECYAWGQQAALPGNF